MHNFLIAIARWGVVLAALFGTSVSASVCRVTTAGLSSNDGSTWSVPMDLQTALGAATCTEIWVAAGVYFAGSSQFTSFVIAPGVAVYGGFAGGETQRAQRNSSLNVTKLSGDIGTSGVATDNTKTIVKMNAVAGNTITASTVLDGFTIADSYEGGNGGGLYCGGAGASNECSPTLANLVFNNNYAVYGGAIYDDARGGGVSSPHLTNVTFTGNLAINNGGAIYNDCNNGGTSSPVLSDVTFSGNTVDGGPGGAMFDEVGNSSPTLSNVTFSVNGGFHSFPPFSGGTFDGGAISHRSTGTLSLNNVTFSGNGYSSAPQGAIYLWTNTSALVMSNVIMWGDVAGPEIDNVGGAPVTITSSVIQGGCPSGSTCLGVITTDPLLGPLQDNGGPTQTMLPMAAGSAVNAGYNASCAATDQRGVPRPQGVNCDIGAVEVVLDRLFADNFDGRPTP
jgi:predicted outer membrane repeat protein